MKLITAIVNDHDAGAVLKTLSDHGIGATKIASTGGFLKRGSAVILVGVDDERLDEAIDLIKRSCGQRRKVEPARQPAGELPPRAEAAEAGGAVLMVSNVERYLRV